MAMSRPTRPPRGTGLLLRRWLRGPLKIGAVAPSGEALSRAMARAVLARLAEPGAVVVELGGGTGSITRALLDEGLPPSRLVSVERDGELVAHLRRHFPGIVVAQGDAARLPELLRSVGVARAGAVVSGLPLLSMPAPVVRAIVGGAFAAMGPAGALVQFTYGPVTPVAPSVLEELGLAGTHGRRIWLNVPPAVVWTYTRR